MLKVKQFLPVLAIVAGITAALAFQAPNSPESVQTLRWFEYLGDVNGNGENDPMDYQEISSPVSICPGGQELCAILAPEDGSSGRPTQQGVNEPEDEAFKN